MTFSFGKFRQSLSERQHRARLHALENEAKKEATELRREAEKEQVEKRIRKLRKNRAKVGRLHNLTVKARGKKKKSLDAQIRGLSKRLSKF